MLNKMASEWFASNSKDLIKSCSIESVSLRGIKELKMKQAKKLKINNKAIT